MFSVYLFANLQSGIKFSNAQFHMICSVCAVTILFLRFERVKCHIAWVGPGSQTISSLPGPIIHGYYATKFFNREFKMIEI